MARLHDTKNLIMAALMAAFTCIFTMVIQIPSPPIGYLHPGDSLVLLSGVILGPITGGLAAAIGSALADILSGYAIYAIPTLLIKFSAAGLAGYFFRRMKHLLPKHLYSSFLTAGIIGESIVIAGYFVTELLLTAAARGSFEAETFKIGMTSALASLLPNTAQGIFGVMLGLALLPILLKVPDIKSWIYHQNSKSK